MDTEITVVSGLPRSGTSVMMQMLDSGGIQVVTDNIRTPDTDNPRGYFEYEIVKKIKVDASWLPATRGKAFKMVSQLLFDLPPSEVYRIIFMDRDIDEMLLSQEKMLKRLGKPVAPIEPMKRAYALHLEKLHDWLRRQLNFVVLRVSYNDLMRQPTEQAKLLREFLNGKASVEGMAKAVDTSLYRNRKAPSADTNAATTAKRGDCVSQTPTPQQESAVAEQQFLDYMI
jgi:Sulfotransferase domain